MKLFHKIIKHPKKKMALALIFVLFLYGIYTLWPVRSLIGPLVSGKTLIVMTNENEARPCGGYASVYGVASVFPPHVSLKNVYGLADHAFGPAAYPLSNVTEQKHFWDGGVSENLETCSETFRQYYQTATGDTTEHVLLLDFGTLETIAQLFPTLSFQDETFDSARLFETLSRSVADVDRHDEEALATRKSPLAAFGKSLIKRSILNPSIPPRITRIMAERLQSGEVYSSKASPAFTITSDDFSAIEWNLGGGKSSRYLQKSVDISGREVAPGEWQWRFGFEAQHLGGYDEPLSQDWRGVFAFHFPDWVGQDPILKETIISPGDKYQQGFIFDTGNVFPENIGLFVPRGQATSYDVAVSLFPQKRLQSKTLITRENVGSARGVSEAGRIEWDLEEIADTTDPFVTIHEFVSLASLPENLRSGFASADSIIELHLNEQTTINLETFSLKLTDKNITHTEITEHPELVVYELAPDGVTLYAGFRNTQKQLEERYALSLQGIDDRWGNALKQGNRTLIDRVPPEEAR